MKTTSSTLIAFLYLTITACGGGLVRGQPPLVGISSLNAQQTEINTRVDIYNPNGVDMEVDTFEMSMTLGDSELGLHSEKPGLSIHPNGTEEISFSFPAEATAGQALSELERGEVNSVPYTINGRVLDSGGDSERFSQRGYLYPVPGRPGEFRGAGPQRDQSHEK
jgi:hypothetical protein